MSFLRRAPVIKSDALRVELGANVSLSASVGISTTGTCNTAIVLYALGTPAGTMDGVATKTTPGGAVSGAFTGRLWKTSSRPTSVYYARAVMNPSPNTSLNPVQSSGTLGNWVQLTANTTWFLQTSGTDEFAAFTLQISNSSAADARILDSTYVTFVSSSAGGGGGGGTK
jgi:hypothetical protein